MKLTVCFLDDTVIEYDNVVEFTYSSSKPELLIISQSDCIYIYLSDVFTFEIS